MNEKRFVYRAEHAIAAPFEERYNCSVHRIHPQAKSDVLFGTGVHHLCKTALPHIIERTLTSEVVSEQACSRRVLPPDGHHFVQVLS